MSEFSPISLAATGFAVLPICRRGKRPLTRHGSKDATTDLAVIQEWRDRWPGCNWGVATGSASGRLLVVDVDGIWDQAGVAWTRLVNAAGLNRPGGLRTPCVWSGSGQSAHWWFRLPKGVSLANSTGRLAASIDTRSAGGYVVVPPSRHPSGGAYEWVMRPDEAPLVELPGLFVEMLQPAPRAPLPRQSKPLTMGLVTLEGKWRLLGIVRRVEAAPKGERHDVVFWAACRIGELVAANHLDAGLGVEALRAAVERFGLTPAEFAAAERTIRDGLEIGGAA